MKNVLVTGARGFIGQNLARVLQGGCQVTGINRADGFDLTNATTFERIQGSFDAVVHLGGLSFVPDSYKNPFEYYRVNLNGALTVAEFCRQRSIPTLIYANTYVYGQPQRLPVDETHPIALPSPYHKTKMLAEDLLRGYFAPDQTQVISLRIFNLYGPGQNERFLVPQLLSEARSTGKVTVRDLEPRRDFLYIKDFVELLRLMLDGRAVTAGAYNVGTGKSCSVAELIATLGEVLGRKLDICDLRERRPNEIMDCHADITKVSQAFGWNPQYGLREGLRDYLSTPGHV